MRHQCHIVHDEPGFRVIDRSQDDDIRVTVESDPLVGNNGAAYARFAVQDLRRIKDEERSLDDEVLPPEQRLRGVVSGHGRHISIVGAGMVKRFASLLSDPEASNGNRQAMEPVADRILAAVTQREERATHRLLHAAATRRAATALSHAPIAVRPAPGVETVGDSLSQDSLGPSAPGQLVIPGFESFVEVANRHPSAAHRGPTLAQVHRAVAPRDLLQQVIPETEALLRDPVLQAFGE